MNPQEVINRVNELEWQARPIRDQLNLAAGEKLARLSADYDQLNRQKNDLLSGAGLQDMYGRGIAGFLYVYGNQKPVPYEGLSYDELIKWGKAYEEASEHNSYKAGPSGEIRSGILEAYRADVARSGMQVNPRTGAVEPKQEAPRPEPERPRQPEPESTTLVQTGIITPDVLQEYPGAQVGDRWGVTEAGDRLLVGQGVEAGDRLIKAEAKESARALSEAREAQRQAQDEAIRSEELQQRQAEARRQADEAERDFKSRNVELADGQFIGKDDFESLPDRYQAIGRQQGLSAMNQTIKNDSAAYDDALKAIKPYEKDDGYNLVAFLRDNPDKADTLKKAGFDEVDISKAKEKAKETPTFVEFYAGWLDKKSSQPKTVEAMQKAVTEAQAEYNKQYSLGERAKVAGTAVAEATVPYFTTVKNWNATSAKDKVIGLAIDTAAVLAIFFGGRAIGAATKALRPVGQVTRLAAKAGQAGRELTAARSAAQAIVERGGVEVADTAGAKLVNLGQATARAKQADLKFLRALDSLKEASPRDLKVIETKANMPGLSKAIRDVSTANKEVQAAWKQADISAKKFNPSAVESSPANTKHLQNLAQLQEKQAKLQQALDNAGSVLKPRYQDGPSPDAFQGYAVNWKAKPKLNLSPEVFNRADDMIRGGPGQTAKKRVAIAVMERQSTEQRLQLKAVYKAAVVAQPKPAIIPKIEIKPSFFDRSKFFPVRQSHTQAEVAKPERLGAMTPEQAARQRGESALTEAISPYIKTGAVPSRIPYVEGMGKADVQQAIRTGQRTYAQSKTEGLTDTEALSRAQADIKQAISPATGISPAAKIQPLARAGTSSLRSVATQPRIVRDILRSQQLRIKDRPILPLKDKDLEAKKKWTKEEIASAVAFRMGAIGKPPKPVTIALKSPYGPGDKKTFVGATPEGLQVSANDVSPKRTIQLLRGKSPNTVTTKIGNQTVRIIRPLAMPGIKGAITFTPDKPTELRSKKLKGGMWVTESSTGQKIYSRFPITRRRRRRQR